MTSKLHHNKRLGNREIPGCSFVPLNFVPFGYITQFCFFLKHPSSKKKKKEKSKQKLF